MEAIYTTYLAVVINPCKISIDWSNDHILSVINMALTYLLCNCCNENQFRLYLGYLSMLHYSATTDRKLTDTASTNTGILDSSTHSTHETGTFVSVCSDLFDLCLIRNVSVLHLLLKLLF